MILKINMSSEDPIYLQLRNQIVIGIGTGELKVGQNLPTVRQMALDIGVNTMTVNKAYTILKNEGFIEIDRRHGAIVSPRADLHGTYQKKLENDLQLLITESSLKGISKEQFITKCISLYQTLNIQKLREKYS